MPSWEIRILSVSYRREGDGVAVQIYGRTREGKSITARVTDFRPYFYVIQPTEDALEMLEDDRANVAEVVKKPVKLFYAGGEVSCVKVYTTFPFVVPTVREKLRGAGFKVLAADIPFHLRFTYDKDLSSCVRITGDVDEGMKNDYTTDLVVKVEKIENIEPFYPNILVMSFDLENTPDGKIITICGIARWTVRGDETVFHLDGGEKDIIEDFEKKIGELDPDVITGYNIDGYDIPRIIERAKALGLKEVNFGRPIEQESMRQFNNRFWRVDGRIIVDAWWQVKKTIKPKQETLGAVSQSLLGETKLDVDPARMREEWATNPDRVKEYCAQDANLALRILEKIKVIRRNLDLATVSKLSLNDVISGTTSLLIDSILIRRADRAGVGVPMTSRQEYEDQIEGGYVHAIESGLYRMVVVEDFKSMYPSLIIAHNICFTTISDKGKTVSPIGVHFLTKDVKEGLLPKILSELMAERDRLKRLMREAKTEDESDYYRGLQEAVKILMNAFYGVFASSFYRFTDQRIGASITAFARQEIQRVIKQLESEKVKVIYSDTDSVFIESPYENVAETVEFGKEVAERFSREGGQLEFEKVLDPLFSHGKKKRYVGRVVWPRRLDELLIRGYETRRTDSFDLQTELLTEVFEKVLDERPEEAVKIARKRISETMEGKVPIEKLVISRGVKNFNEYDDPDRLAHVQAAKKLMALGYEFVPGMKVSWIVTNSKRTPQEVQPYISGIAFEGVPDWKYYATRLAQSVARATENFGWTERDLLAGSQQVDLFSGAFSGEESSIKGEQGKEQPKEKKDGVKKTEKKVSLQDFM